MKLGVRTWAGSAHDEFIQLTEGVVASETLDDPVDGLVDFTVERLAPQRGSRRCSRRAHGRSRSTSRAASGRSLPLVRT